MSFDSGFKSDQVRRYLTWGALPVAAIVLLFRNLPVGPILAGDEMAYSMMSRKLPYQLDWIPNYIFYLVYSSTNYCGAQFYSCSKILNVFFFLLAGLFVFLTTRLFVGAVVSLLIMLAFLVSPFNVYTTQFMPETMYGAVAWILLYFFISRSSDWKVSSLIAAGGGVAVLSMIKPHGIFFGAVYLCALIFDIAVPGNAKGSAVAKKIAIFIASFLIVRLPIGYAFAGRHGLNILGTSYSAYVTVHPFADYLQLLALAATSAFRHVLAMCLVAGVPLCIMLMRSFRSSPDTVKASKLNSFAVTFFVVMIGVTAAFTANVVNTAPGEIIVRLHTRYYNYFEFVFCLVVVAELMRNDQPKISSKIAIGASIAIVAVGSMVYLPTHFQRGLMDNPDIHGLFRSDVWFHVFAAVNIALVVLWVCRSRAAGTLFLILQVPLGLALSTSLLTQDIRSMAEYQYHSSYAKAGDLARVIWGNPQPEFFVAGAGGSGEGFHTVFHVDKDGTRIELGPNETLHRTAIPKGVLNGIIVGEHPTDFSYVLTYSDGPIKIIKIIEP